MRKQIARATIVAALFGFTSAAWAAEEVEPEEGASGAEALAEGEPMLDSGAVETGDGMTGSDAAADTASEPASPNGRVARSGFTSEVLDHEPIDTLSSLTNEVEAIAYFTELRDFTGSTVVHQWSYGGEVVAEVPFEVGGSRWRVHSTKRLDPSALGEWSVSVVADGRIVATERLTYTDAPEEAFAPTEASEAATFAPVESEVTSPPASLAPAPEEAAE